jgi:hypothetical protein
MIQRVGDEAVGLEKQKISFVPEETDGGYLCPPRRP